MVALDVLLSLMLAADIVLFASTPAAQAAARRTWRNIVPGFFPNQGNTIVMSNPLCRSGMRCVIDANGLRGLPRMLLVKKNEMDNWNVITMAYYTYRSPTSFVLANHLGCATTMGAKETIESEATSFQAGARHNAETGCA